MSIVNVLIALCFIALFFLARFFFGRRPDVEWSDGIVQTDLYYGRMYAEVVARVRAVQPDAVIAPAMLLAVRVYPDGLPKPFHRNWGKVVVAGTVPGDDYGTICLVGGRERDDDLVLHECFHAVTGIPDHPTWAFKPGSLALII